jgi:hypothetical protein
MLLTDMRHLESKKDRTYSSEILPRNYWTWVNDGVLAGGPAPKVTLDSFLS